MILNGTMPVVGGDHPRISIAAQANSFHPSISVAAMKTPETFVAGMWALKDATRCTWSRAASVRDGVPG